MKCSKCGAENEEGFKFCGVCGTPLGLSERALQIATEKPNGWAARLFAQVLTDEIESIKARAKQGQSESNPNADFISLFQYADWVLAKMNWFQNITDQIVALENSYREVEKSGDVSVVVSLSQRFAAYYKEVFDWSETVRKTHVDSQIAEIPAILSSRAAAIAEGVARSGPELLRQVEDALNPAQTGDSSKDSTPRLRIMVHDSERRFSEAVDRSLAVIKSNSGIFHGQESLTERIRFQIQLAKKQGTALKHVLLCGPDGEGKTFFAASIAKNMRVSYNMQVSFKWVEASRIERPHDLVAMLTKLRAGDIFLIKHIEHLNQQCVSVLAPAMADFVFDTTIGKGSSARSIQLKLPRFGMCQ